MVSVWAEKVAQSTRLNDAAYTARLQEMRNLKRIHASGIRCPEALMLRSHVLLMRFLGKVRVTLPVHNIRANGCRTAMQHRDSKTRRSVQTSTASAITSW